jgi:hypothetical protein
MPPPARVSQPRAACPLCATPLSPEDRACPLCCYELDLLPLPPLRRARDLPSRPGWRVTVRVDPTLDEDPDPALPCPVGAPEFEREIDGEEVTVGRDLTPPSPPLPGGQRGEEKGMLLLGDPGVSRRHAALQRAEGGLWIVDLASTNGTRVNGVLLEPRVRTPLRAGDEVTLGRWTRLRVLPR